MKRLRHVAVLIETSREYGRGLLRGVARFHHERAAWSIYFKPHDLGSALPDWLAAWSGDGILARITNRTMADVLRATNLPLIDLRGGGIPAGVLQYGLDNESVCRMGFEHLRDCRLKYFAFCGESRGRHVYDDERREQFEHIVREHGGTCHVFIHHHGAGVAESWEDEQQRLLEWLRSLPKPVGIMACHDDRAQQILDACLRGELAVPDEIAVLGVDNDRYLCGLSLPPLSSIDVNSERIGYQAALLLNRLMDGESVSETQTTFDAASVVARQSTDLLACDDQAVSAAVRLIRDRACHGINVADVIKHAGLSSSQLHRRFKAIVGHTPKEEILRVRIARAKQLLIDTDLPIARVSERTGFGESKYFIGVFRNRVGTTPRAFRQCAGRHATASDHRNG